MNFVELNMSSLLLKALETLSYEEATPIQVAAIPQLLQGADVLATAQTGTGKTAAFGLPMLQVIQGQKDLLPRTFLRGLILAPTRELVVQIGQSLKSYARFTKLRVGMIYGGVGKGPQISMLKNGLDILVATPGRLLDLIQMGVVRLNQVSYFVLDEGDQMLDMGFIPDIQKIVATLPAKRQTMLFSATMPESILDLSRGLLQDPIRIAVGQVEQPLSSIEQGVYFVKKEDKSTLLAHLLKDSSLESVLIFTRTKHGADKLEKDLIRHQYKSEVIHGNKGQQMRMQALQKFKSKESRILIATDIAARGIDISKISHVINYDLPQTPETYLHRMGRTGRAGQVGIAINFCANEERGLLKDIQRHTGVTIPVLVSSKVEAPYYQDSRSSYVANKKAPPPISNPFQFFQATPSSKPKGRRQEKHRSKDNYTPSRMKHNYN